MGVPFRIVLYASNREHAENAAQAAFRRVEQLNQKLSDYETDSELNELSRTSGEGRAVPVSDDLWYVLSEGQKLARRSEGAFDMTVGPYVSLWRRARRMKELPDGKLLAEAANAVGYEKVMLDPSQRRVTLKASGMKLDLGGIAKGYAVDEAMKVVRKAGVKSALIAASGDIAVSDPPPGLAGWKIGLVDLEDSPNLPKASLILRHRAVSTSGDAAQHLEINGTRYSHIVDPRTGIGLTDHSLVTVVARTCTASDSLATAISVLGPANGLDWVSRQSDVEVRILRPSNRGGIERVQSPGFARLVERLGE